VGIGGSSKTEMNSVKKRWLFPRSEPWELFQRVINSAISTIVLAGILNKNGVFDEENPCHYSENIATN
jgi:hypothetical protein